MTSFLNDMDLYFEKFKDRELKIRNAEIEIRPYGESLNFILSACKSVNGHLFFQSLHFTQIPVNVKDFLDTNIPCILESAIGEFIESRGFCLTEDLHLVPSVFKDSGLSYEEIKKLPEYELALELL